MANARFSWGIDIGNRAVKAIKLIRDGDVLRVDDFEVIEHETVLSNSGDNREALITQALKSFVERHPMKGGSVSVGVSGQSSFARFIKLPPVEAKKIPEIVRFEAIQQIPFPLDDVEWSYQLFQAPDSPDIEVGIFAMRKELINQHIKNFTDLDMNVQTVQMNPLAVYNAMHFDQHIEGTTMIIDLGAENTDLIIADSETVWLRSIPIGGNNFTEALVKSFKLNFAKAEDLKRNAATSKYARQIFQAMRPVFADLVAEVQRSIGFYASVHRDSRIRKILTVGGTFKLPGLQKYLQQNLQLEVERIDTLGAGSPPDPKLAATFQDNILSVVSAYGLALQGMGEGKITDSLLPQRIRRERLWLDKRKYFAAAASLFVFGSAIGYGAHFLSDMKYQSGETARGTIQRVMGTAQGLDTSWGTIQQSGSADRERIKNVQSLTDYRDLWINILADVQKIAPPIPADVNQLKQTPRAQRKQVMIDSIDTRYYPDLTQILARPLRDTVPSAGAVGAPSMPGFGVSLGVLGGAGDGNMPPPDFGGMSAAEAGVAGGAAGTAVSPDTVHGFLLIISGTTPFNTDPAGFLADAVVKTLSSMDQKKMPPGKRYYFNKVEIAHVESLRRNETKLSGIKAAFDAAVAAKTSGQFTAPAAVRGFGGPMGDSAMENSGMFPGAANFGAAAGAGGPAAPDEKKPFLDRVMNEDIRDDVEFVAVAAIVIDPAPLAAEAPADAAAPTDAAPADPAAAPADGAAAPATAPADATAAPAEGTPAAPADAAAAPATPAATPAAAPAATDSPAR